jgi:hypothetical protein
MFASYDGQGRCFKRYSGTSKRSGRGVIGPSGFDTAALIRDFPSMIALTVALYIIARGLNRAAPGRVSRRTGH